MEGWSRPSVVAVVLALMVSAISWCLSAAGPVPGHEDVSYRGQEGKTGLTAQAQQLVTDSDHDGEADDGSGSLHIQYLQGSGAEAVHSGDEDQEQHNDHPAESGSSGFNTEQEMEDSLKEFAEAAAALEKEYLDLPAGVMQPAAQEQHHLQNTDSQPAASLTLHLEDEKEKSDIPAYQTSSARDARGLQLDSRPTETAAHPATSKSELQMDSQHIEHHQQQQQMAAPKPGDAQPVYQPPSFPHLLPGFKPTAKLRQLASAVGRTELEQMFESFVSGFIDYMSDVGEDDEDDEDESQSSSVAQDDVDSSSTKHHFSGHHVTQQANQPSNPNLQATSVDLATNVKNTDSPSENEKSSDSSGSAVSGHQDDHETESSERAV
ncbi:uncharacterized protein LOC112573520 isoform X3 [Pomacea canaliculata]|uniref:uncharacterized protein LOC112573520 isoform X3 n=1 Tax=Pomacea canaliculata TaxID=400727 RepID=UPI000D72553B|nr:uncharacterized protein LOC112573520 isoform X3 [Pomacea canaliculata]